MDFRATRAANDCRNGVAIILTGLIDFSTDRPALTMESCSSGLRIFLVAFRETPEVKACWSPESINRLVRFKTLGWTNACRNGVASTFAGLVDFSSIPEIRACWRSLSIARLARFNFLGPANDCRSGVANTFIGLIDLSAEIDAVAMEF